MKTKITFEHEDGSKVVFEAIILRQDIYAQPVDVTDARTTSFFREPRKQNFIFEGEIIGSPIFTSP